MSYSCYLCKVETSNLTLHNLSRAHYLKAKNKNTQKRFSTNKIRAEMKFQKLQTRLIEVQKTNS
ncbi:MAG TPA: hypothetical protein VLE02_02675, partial [Nitrosarchaeum sp.]|nr:hypothetical protein [Nitrosarchaeum sp.]